MTNDENYSELSTVESQRNDLVPEEFPEGAYGSGIQKGALAKSKPWRIGQHRQSAYGYENRQLHSEQRRHYPGDDDYGSGVPEVLDEP